MEGLNQSRLDDFQEIQLSWYPEIGKAYQKTPEEWRVVVEKAGLIFIAKHCKVCNRFFYGFKKSMTAWKVHALCDLYGVIHRGFAWGYDFPSGNFFCWRCMEKGRG